MQVGRPDVGPAHPFECPTRPAKKGAMSSATLEGKRKAAYLFSGARLLRLRFGLPTRPSFDGLRKVYTNSLKKKRIQRLLVNIYHLPLKYLVNIYQIC
ncbi:MAG: hypothetical protein FD135_3606 [Comamonadaceae bacterium]|nr:MAG: hypothetical protein FD135_3606 [Comamonadaceae bacterium]